MTGLLRDEKEARRDGCDHAAPAVAEDMGSTHVVCRYVARPSWRDMGPDFAASRPRAEEWPGYGRKSRACRAHGGFRVRMASTITGTIVETDAEVGLLMNTRARRSACSTPAIPCFRAAIRSPDQGA
jgi:hypothetical protein